MCDNCSVPAITQKARGVMELRRCCSVDGISRGNVQDSFILCRSCAEGKPKIPAGRFVRPCPERPRHGFVESRVIRSSAEFKKLILEVKKASGKDEWEVIAAPHIRAMWSAVITDSGISIGPGNDGATSGHESVFIGATGDGVLREFGHNAKALHIKESPYIEVVSSGHKNYTVQIRDGPKVTQATSFVPNRTRVRRVVLARGDLLKWEKITRKLKSGDVVWHPGGTMSSHYAVHCVANGIPILFGEAKRPRIGTVLKPSKRNDEWDIGRICSEIITAEKNVTKWRNADAIVFSSAAVHAFPSMDASPYTAAVLGRGIAYAYRLSAEAISGEIEYGKNIYHFDQEALTAGKLMKELRKCTKGFMDGHWMLGFGGRSWAKGSTATAKLIKQVAKMMIHQKKENLLEVIESWNEVIDAVHNGGETIVSKIGGECGRLYTAAGCPGVAFATSNELFNLLYDKHGKLKRREPLGTAEIERYGKNILSEGKA